MKTLFNGAYNGRRVLITGHTGFKGAWLTTWLLEMGAEIVGFSLPEPPSDPCMFDLLGLGEQIVDLRGDVRDFDRLAAVFADYQPEVVFHMAAQPIVLKSVEDPKTTFDINAGGTVNVLEAVRRTPGVRAMIAITTDKVYENREWLWGYRETDRLGGHDPYSASKTMAEQALAAYRSTYFHPDRFGEHGVGVASVRAGNVIGGGDLAPFRLVPDCMRALMADAGPIQVRNPASIRPWQHVLVPLSGYLLVGLGLLQDGPHFADAWNFGPLEQVGVPAVDLVEKLIEIWGSGRWEQPAQAGPRVETGQLRLSWEKAANRLDWSPIFNWEDALYEIVAWFKAYQNGVDLMAVTRDHIGQFVGKARQIQATWL